MSKQEIMTLAFFYVLQNVMYSIVMHIVDGQMKLQNALFVKKILGVNLVEVSQSSKIN